jgi:rod shape-determining protein MreC
VKRSSYWAWILAASVLVLAIGGLCAAIRPATGEALLPYQRATFWFRHHVLGRAVRVLARTEIVARQAALEREVSRLRQAETELERVAAENQRLRALLGFQAPAPWRAVSAPVLSRGGMTGWWQGLCLGKGAADGVAVGDPVVVPDGLVGRVSTVSAHTSDVLLLTDPNCRVACELDPPPDGVGAVRGVLYGAGGRSGPRAGLTLLYVVDPLRLRYLQRDVQPAPLTRVVSSGLGGGFPRGLAVGFLLASRVSADGLYREADVLPAADLAVLDAVFVLTGGEVRP